MTGNSEEPDADLAPDERTPRPMCTRCLRPARVCYCAALTRLETRSRVVILQHPRERGMPIGTAHMANLCLPQSSLHVGIEWDDGDVLREACGDPERPAILLYPGPGARDILSDPPAAPVTLIVVDGTWAQARTVVRKNPALAALPRYAFQPAEPSNYRIRRAPRAEYVSTLEALMHVLGAIEGDAGRFRALMRPMNAMVDAQIEAQAAELHPRVPRVRPRKTPYERLPPLIRNRAEDLVLVFGDANAWPHGTPERELGDELVYWVAHRPRTGETFSFVIAPRKPLAPDIPRCVGLSAEQLMAGGTGAEMLSAFAAFLRPTDVLASWGFHSLRLFKDCGGTTPAAYVDLKQAARAFTQQKVGALERHGIQGGVVPATGPAAGRAGLRVGVLLRLLDSWRGAPGPEEPAVRAESSGQGRPGCASEAARSP